MRRKKFPNGFRSWMETHHEVVSYITGAVMLDNHKDSAITRIQYGLGSAGLYDLGKEWTNEFERIHKGRKWDGEFFDEIEAFCEFKNNEVLPTSLIS